jgi:hypothetical protein
VAVRTLSLAEVHIKRGSSDPGRTGPLRKSFRAAADMQLNQLRASLRQALIEFNVLGLSGGPANYSMMSSGARLNQFAGWLENAANASLDARWWAHPWLDKATQHGLASGQQELQGVEYQPIPTTFASLHELARHELRGIIAALVQKVVRQAHSASTRRLAPHQAYRELVEPIDGDIRNRLQLFAQHFGQKGHIHGKAEYFRQAGIRKFGINPELQVRRKKARDAVSGIHHHRTFRDDEPADVTWVTADDDLVCADCDEMAAGSPYSLDEVMDLIPLHPNCRCDLTTYDGPEELDDALTVDAFDPDEERDDHGRWSGSGGGMTATPVGLAEIERLNPGALARAKQSTSSFEHIAIPVEGKEFIAYHGTTEEVVASIRRTGLKSHASPAADVWAAKQNIQVGQLFMAGDRAKSVYMATDLSYAYSFAKIAADVRHQHPTMLEIHIPAAEAKDHLYVDEQADKDKKYIARYVGDIKPEWIKREVSSTGYNKESAALDKQPDVVIYATVFDALPAELAGGKHRDAEPDFTQDPSTGRFTGSIGHGGIVLRGGLPFAKPPPGVEVSRRLSPSEVAQRSASVSKKKAKIEDFEKAQITLGYDIQGSKDRTKKFVDDWDKHVGAEPAEFKTAFLGGQETSMRINTFGNSGVWDIEGAIYDHGTPVGNYRRAIDWNDRTAESALLQLRRGTTGKDIGKKILAGNIATYKKLGIERVKVHANIDVGGYAWAKYGYVPSVSSWINLSSTIRRRLDTSRPASRSSSSDVYEPTSWQEIHDDDQDNIRQAFMSATQREFMDSEVDSWRDNGEDLHQAKTNLASNFDGTNAWAAEVVAGWRKDNPEVPYSYNQIMQAVTVKYDDENYDGRADPKIEFNDDKLREPSDMPSREQMVLPGFEEIDPAAHLTAPMRDELAAALVDAFNAQANEDRDNIEPPDYLRESASESQDDYWDGMEDSERYRWANRNGQLPQYPVEHDEDDEPKQKEIPLPDKDADLRALAQSSNPKAIWAIADSPRGKELLLNSDWYGSLNLNDKESMDRFNAYVGKSKKAAA